MRYIFLVLMAVFLLMIFLCRNYGKNAVKPLNKKRDPLRLVYGFSMFLLDKCIWTLVMRFQKSTAEKIRMLAVRDGAKKEMYLYSMRKVSICIVVSFALLFLGFCVCTVGEKNNFEVTVLNRPDTGDDISYRLEAVVDGDESQSINVVVAGEAYTEEEIREIIESSYDGLLEKMLGENDSQEYVNRPLNLVSELDGGVKVSWMIDNTDIVDYSGTIGKDVSSAGEIAILSATLSYEDQSITYDIVCCVYPETEEEKGIEQKVQDIVDGQADNGRSVVVLPTELDGNTINFYSSRAMSALIFLVLACLLPLAVFILKDRDLNSKVKKRNTQMMYDYPEIVGRLRLYIGAGMTVKNAWEKIVGDYEKRIAMPDGGQNERKRRYAYEEMRLALAGMNAGVPEVECYNRFGSRCKLHSYLKLSSILEQNVKRGAKGMDKMLAGEVNDTFEERKNLAKKLGEEAGTKLLAPMVIMLVITIIVIIFPALTSMNF